MITINRFPKKMDQYPVDKTNLRKCLVSGLFEEQIEINGCLRCFYTYLTPGLEYDSKCLVVVPPADIDIQEYLQNSPWISFAETKKIFLHILKSADGTWSYDGSDADFMNKVYMKIQARDYYVTMQDNIYAIGVGDGATVAQQAIMKMTSEWAGMATFGNLDDAAILCEKNTNDVDSKEDMGRVELAIYAQKAQIPVWMVWPEKNSANTRIMDYWKEQNDVAGEKYASGFADEIYLPNPVYKKSSVNDENISQVRITNGWKQNLSEDMITEVWSYISQCCRHRCFTQKALRRFKNPVDFGAEYRTIEVDGYTRCWFEYIPKHLKESRINIPMVITMHGRGGSAESFFDLSGLSCVAEERDFIAVFPESGIYQQKPGGLKNVLAWNGSYDGKSIDDVKFIKAMIEDIKKRYSVDTHRIYACGQSSGGMMTAELAVRAPEIFAAVSPWSALRDPDKKTYVPKSIHPKVPFLFLLGENDWLCVDKKDGKLEYKVTDPIAEYLQNLMLIYKLETKPHTYQCGEITYYVYPDAQKVPMLIVGTVKDMSHANYPRESWIAYDEFFSKFVKEDDGTLKYMGEKVL